MLTEEYSPFTLRVEPLTEEDATKLKELGWTPEKIPAGEGESNPQGS